MKIVFMGTPDFAVPTLRKIAEAGHEIGYVVTQPDRPGNRNKILPPPVKIAAEELGIPVLQPDDLAEDRESKERLREFAPDAFVVAAFGQILKKDMLELPRLGAFNVHASLLPAYRGAAPMQHAILDGVEKSGVTIMKMDEGLDTGDMVSKVEVDIRGMDMGTLHDTLAEKGGKLMVDTLMEIDEGRAYYTPQDEELASYAGKITKKDGKLDFSKDAAVLERQIRAMRPWPGSYCNMGDSVLKIWDADAEEDSVDAAPGTIRQRGDTLLIKCGRGSLKVRELQMPGKKKMCTGDFLRGSHIPEGLILT